MLTQALTPEQFPGPVVGVEGVVVDEEELDGGVVDGGVVDGGFEVLGTVVTDPPPLSKTFLIAAS